MLIVGAVLVLLQTILTCNLFNITSATAKCSFYKAPSNFSSLGLTLVRSTSEFPNVAMINVFLNTCVSFERTLTFIGWFKQVCLHRDGPKLVTW